MNDMNDDPIDHATVTVERTLDAPAQRVFDAWLDPEILVRWFCGSKAQTVEAWTCPRADGCYLVVMRGEGRDWPHAGHYLEIDPPRRLRFTWYTPSTDNQRTDVDVRLAPVDGGTHLVLTHTGLAAPSASGFRDGWDELLGQLQGAV